MVARLKRARIKVSLFVEPSIEAVKLSHELGADAVELHTGRYCLAAQGKFGARSPGRAKAELERVNKAARAAEKIGIHAHAGHGLDYVNVRPMAALLDSKGELLIEEYNIGHSIVCRAAMIGLEPAVREMLSAIAAP